MIKIVGYGSLMCEKSAQKTCEISNFSYGYIKGYSRIFNKLGFNPFLEKYNDNTAMLNIFEDERSWLVISFFDVSNQDYVKMRQREWDYEEVEVDIYDINKTLIQKAVVFISKEKSVFQGNIVKLIRPDIEPEKRYLDICFSALKKTPYFEDFINSTYLSCGEKKICEVI